MDLRPYQAEARDAVWDQWNSGVKKTLLVLPTGCGKTIVFSKIIEDAVRVGGRALVLAHRSELLTQAADKLEKACGLKASVEKAEESCLGSWYRVVVGSVQTLQRQKRLDKFSSNYFDYIIIDEAHHAISAGYQTVINHFKTAKILGVTATPDRSDKKNLGKVFSSLAYEYTLPEAIKDGYLVPIEAETIPLKIDLSGASITSGDFSASDVGDALEPYLEQIATEMESRCKGRKTVVFLPLVATSKRFARILRNHGFRAAEVDGGSADREEVLRDFAENKYNVICNAMLLTEGWDCPDVDCVIVLRATKVRALYVQMVGRGTRLAPGKEKLLLLDFLWHTERHNLCRPASLVTDDEEIAEIIQKKVEEATTAAIDLSEAEQEAESEAAAATESRLAEQLKAMRSRKSKLVDPLQYAASIQMTDLLNYTAMFEEELKPMTEKQRDSLEHFGINASAVSGFGEASKILDALKKRRAEALTTPKQIRLLERYGFRHVGTWRFSDASALINRIASAGWVVPAGVSPSTYAPESQSNAGDAGDEFEGFLADGFTPF